MSQIQIDPLVEGYGVAVAAGLPVAGHAGLHQQPLALVVVVGCNGNVKFFAHFES